MTDAVKLMAMYSGAKKVYEEVVQKSRILGGFAKNGLVINFSSIPRGKSQGPIIRGNK